MRDRLTIPMAAKPYRADRTTFPAMVQPKFNGIRAHWDGDVAWTRTPRLHKPHVQKLFTDYMSNIPEGWILDGELMLPRCYSFQQTVSAIKKENEFSPHLKFVIYDVNIFNKLVPFSDRWKRLGQWFSGLRTEVKDHKLWKLCSMSLPNGLLE